MQALVDQNGVEIVVFSDRTSAWHKFATDSVILRKALMGDVPEPPKEKRRNTRLFHLARREDASGVSGTGIVAEIGMFSDGICAMRWLTSTASTGIYDSPEDLIAIHGHEGRTVMQTLDGKLWTP